MKSDENIAQTVGVLLLLHLVVGLTTPFILIQAVPASPGFLRSAAENATQMRVAVLLLFAGSAIAIGVSISALPILRRYSAGMALWLLGLAVASFSLQVVDNGRLLAMLSLSQEYAKRGADNLELFQSLAIIVGSARKWSHYTYLLVAVSWIFLLFAMLYRFQLVPRVLAGLGLVASLLQIIGVSLRGIFGYAPETRLAMPLAPVYVALAVWLIVKGFRQSPKPYASHAFPSAEVSKS